MDVAQCELIVAEVLGVDLVFVGVDVIRKRNASTLPFKRQTH